MSLNTCFPSQAQTFVHNMGHPTLKKLLFHSKQVVKLKNQSQLLKKNCYTSVKVNDNLNLFPWKDSSKPAVLNITSVLHLASDTFLKTLELGSNSSILHKVETFYIKLRIILAINGGGGI